MITKKDLEDLENKCDWEGGLDEMLFGYGAADMFPVEVWELIDNLRDARDALKARLAEMSDAVGYTERIGYW